METPARAAMSLIVGGAGRGGVREEPMSKRFDHRAWGQCRQPGTVRFVGWMASLWEPPALLTLAVLLGGGAGAIYYALRPALKGPLPEVTSERDEVWGVDDPPPPAKKPYVYPDQRPVPVLLPVAPGTDREPEPLAVMADGPTVAPLPAPMPASVEALEEAPSTS